MRISVNYGETSVGRLNDDTGPLLFQYDNDFLARKIELSPLYLPLQRGVIETQSPFEGQLPGLFADSLPDVWGRTIMDQRLREAGTAPQSVSILKRLALIGTGGMGALSYHPEESNAETDFTHLQEAMQFARAVIEERAGNLPGPQQLQEAAGSPGGRFPKLLVGWNEDSEKLMIGSHDYSEGYLPCILKLDMGKLEASYNQGLCRKEYQLLTAARTAGIEASDHWLIEGEDKEQGPFEHLLVKRFDRIGTSKVHTHTFGGVTQQLAVRYGSSYEDLLRTTLALCKDQRQVVQQFRRMVFNVLAGNRDDHVRNHSFLLNESTGWKLSPAYDLTPTPTKTEHALSIHSKWNAITDTDLLAVADLFSIHQPSEIIEQCRDALSDHGLMEC